MSKFSIKHPIIIIMLFIGFTVLGFVSLNRMSVSLLPNFGMPNLAIIVTYPGVGPKDIEKDILVPIEKAVSSLSGVEKIESTGVENFGIVVLSFKWGTDLDIAQVNVREKINEIIDNFPAGADRPYLRKFDVSNMPVITLTVEADMDRLELRHFLEENIINRLNRQDGVGEAKIIGGNEKIIEITMDLGAMEARKISIVDLLKQLQYENISFPAGNITLKNKDFTVRTIGDFNSLNDIASLIIGYKDGAYIRLKDVAKVHFSYEENRKWTRSANDDAVAIFITKQSDKNEIDVINAVKAEIKRIEKEYKGLKFNILSDQSKDIKKSILSVTQAAWQGAILAVIVLFIFLRNFRATLIIAISIPLSVIMTFTLMDLSGKTINILTLGGLTIGIGMLVDSSIVVLENIYRHFHQTGDKLEASEIGAKEVTGAILASTITNIAVFIPMLFVTGIPGMALKDLSITAAFSIGMSLIVALTLIPLMTSKIMKDENFTFYANLKYFKLFSDGFAKFFERIEKKYSDFLENVLYKRKLVFGIAIIAFILSLTSFKFLGYEFLPEMDLSEFLIKCEFPIGTTLEETAKHVKKITDIINKNVPESSGLLSIVGQYDVMTASTGSHYAFFQFRLKDVNERKRSIFQIMDFIRDMLKKNIPGLKMVIEVGGLGAITNNAIGAGAPVEFEIRGKDLDSLYEAGEKILSIVKSIQGTRDAKLSISKEKPEFKIKINREESSSLGLSAYEIALATRAALNGIEIGSYKTGGEDYRIWIRLKKKDRDNIDALKRMFVISPSGSAIPLSSICSFEIKNTPAKILRINQERVLKVQSNIFNTDIKTVADTVMKKLQNVKMPNGVRFKPGGANEEMVKAYKSLALALLLSIFLVYLVMVIQFENFIQPLIVMFSIPFSFVGVAGSLIIFHTKFSITPFLGIIMLAGIVVNNAIVLVDYTNLMRTKDMPIKDAVLLSARTRLRPILMTTLTTVLGLIPMALKLGSGSEMYGPIGQAVLGGLSTSTLITLILIPVIYTFVEEKKIEIKNRKSHLFILLKPFLKIPVIQRLYKLQIKLNAELKEIKIVREKKKDNQIISSKKKYTKTSKNIKNKSYRTKKKINP